MPNKAALNLTGKYPANTYQAFMQFDTASNGVFNGLGDQVTSSVAITASWALMAQALASAVDHANTASFAQSLDTSLPITWSGPTFFSRSLNDGGIGITVDYAPVLGSTYNEGMDIYLHDTSSQFSGLASVGLWVGNDLPTHGGIGAMYNLNGSVGVTGKVAETAVGTLGDVIGVLGLAYNGGNSIGVSGFSSGNALTASVGIFGCAYLGSPYTIGGYFETHTFATPPNPPFGFSAVVVADNRDSFLPLFIGQTEGLRKITIDDQGNITASKFEGVSSFAVTASYVNAGGYSGSIQIRAQNGVTHSLSFVNGILVNYVVA